MNPQHVKTDVKKSTNNSNKFSKQLFRGFKVQILFIYIFSTKYKLTDTAAIRVRDSGGYTEKYMAYFLDFFKKLYISSVSQIKL